MGSEHSKNVKEYAKKVHENPKKTKKALLGEEPKMPKKIRKHRDRENNHKKNIILQKKKPTKLGKEEHAKQKSVNKNYAQNEPQKIKKTNIRPRRTPSSEEEENTKHKQQ